MDCSEASSRLADLAVGELSAGERGATEGHLQDCPSCLDRWNATRRAIGAYRTLAEFEPSPSAWGRIAEAVRRPQGVRRAVPPRRIYSYLYTAAAAASLLAAISFLVHLVWPGERPAAYVSYAADGSVGEAIPYGRRVTFDAYRELTIPGYGLARVREGTELRIERPLAVELVRGEGLFEVHRPITVGTPHGTVRALGTRFGVRVDSTESLVYVLDGSVRVQENVASDLRAGQAGLFGPHISGYGAAPAPAAYHLLWLAAHRPARIDLAAEGTATADGLDLVLDLTNDSPVPLALPQPDNDRAFLVAEIDGLPPIDLRETILAVSALAAPDGRLLVDADHPARITCAVPAGVLPRPGRYAVRIAYYALRDGSAPDAWSGRADAQAPVWWETTE